ncbi:RGS domain-containing protein [Ochromonadaceae sp. CCMP2298]|nr:RGS domain-containing protein [Ochromonadaceae sp. CCMP2298]|mmetsp:Transcript_35076/g.77292  ORF Transcript_35076/g.77292 Transcript_35076/m.77292 type:complete len:261 (+) Transcript_35076:263-1045(+)
MGCVTSKVLPDRVDSRPVSEKENSCSLNLAGLPGMGSVKTLTFKCVMDDMLGREYFKLFLEFEHAEENLLFYVEVEKLKLREMQEINDCLKDLVALFLKQGVEKEVNLSYLIRMNILKMVDDNPEERVDDLMGLLDKAQKEIMNIMAMGAFPRFMKHKYFHEYKMKAHERDISEQTEDELRVSDPESADQCDQTAPKSVDQREEEEEEDSEDGADDVQAAEPAEPAAGGAVGRGLVKADTAGVRTSKADLAEDFLEMISI